MEVGAILMKKYKVIDHCWHQAHSWELLKNPYFEWYYLLNTYRKWHWTIRGADLPATWVPYIEKEKYDFAILHLDQSCIDPRLGKSKLFREAKEAVKGIPTVVLMHGTPMLDGYTEKEVIYGGAQRQLKNSNKFITMDGIKDLVGDLPMIVNSYRSKERWGWGDVIWHGMDKDEWYHDLPKEPRVITTMSPAGMSNEYYGRHLLQAVRQILAEDFGIKHQWVMLDYEPEFDCKKVHRNAFDSYRDFIGRSLIYFNPTFDSPMPRSRTEAMLSGCCTITTNYHDEDKFIKSGVNGFIVPKDAYMIANLIKELIYNHPKEAEEIGKRGRQTAIETFDVNRFSNDWLDFIENKLLKGYTGKDQVKKEPAIYNE